MQVIKIIPMLHVSHDSMLKYALNYTWIISVRAGLRYGLDRPFAVHQFTWTMIIPIEYLSYVRSNTTLPMLHVSHGILHVKTFHYSK